MSAVELLQPILQGGLERNNFFNGRLLSAEDLSAEQLANRVQHGLLGRALGDGVAWGLAVSSLSVGPEARVRVTHGVALNRRGDILHLPEDAEVTLVPAEKAAEVSSGLFVECEAGAGPTMQAAEGAYVLVVAPTSGYRDTALVSDPNSTEVGRGACGARFTVEGVRFRLVPVGLSGLGAIKTRIDGPPALLPPDTDIERERLRNLLAHACFGTDALRDYFTTGFEPEDDPPGWGVLDAMRQLPQPQLTDCDVPLAIVVLKSKSISFVDQWSARRRLIDAGAIDAWRAVAGPRRFAEGEAAFLQFQDQLAGVKGLEPGTIASVNAKKYFDYLPAGGWLTTGPGGFSWKAFLGEHAPPEVSPVDDALLRGIIERSWFDDGFALNTSKPVPLRVYQAPDKLFVVFARSHGGNIRVTLKRAPGAATGKSVEIQARAVGGPVTSANSATADRLLLLDLVPGVHNISVASPDYAAVAPRQETVVGGRTVDIEVELKPPPNGSILVRAIDAETDDRITGKVDITTQVGGTTKPAVPAIIHGDFELKDLPPSAYRIEGSATGYKPATLAVVSVTSGNQTTVDLVFTPQAPGKDQPSRCITIFDAPPGLPARVQLCMVLPAAEFEESYYYEVRLDTFDKTNIPIATFAIGKRAHTVYAEASRRATASGVIVYSATAMWDDMMKLQFSSDVVDKWLRQWRDWFAGHLGDEQIRNSVPGVFVETGYLVPSPDTIPETPAAYAVFGRFAVPLEVKPLDFITKGPVRIDEVSRLPWLTAKLKEELLEAQILYLDDFPWAWRELLVDITGQPPETLSYMKEEILEEVSRINTELGYYTAVPKVTLDSVLVKYKDDVAIANADLGELTQLVGSRVLAAQMIEQARRIVPAESWQLTGFTPAERAGLATLGVVSHGSFLAKAATPEGRTEMAGPLGMSNLTPAERDQAIKEAGDASISVMTTYAVALAPVASVYAMATVTADSALKLEHGGFPTAQQLAEADPAVVAEKASIPLEEARKVVNEAKSASIANLRLGSVVPLSSAGETALAGAVGAGKVTVGTIAKMDPNRLAGLLDVDLNLAKAMINGLKEGLKAVPTRGRIIG